jgi:hypothetical protein
MPQAARAAPAAGRSACRHRPNYPGRREPFSPTPLRTARRRLVKPAQSASAETWERVRSRQQMHAFAERAGTSIYAVVGLGGEWRDLPERLLAELVAGRAWPFVRRALLGFPTFDQTGSPTVLPPSACCSATPTTSPATSPPLTASGPGPLQALGRGPVQ